MRSQDLLLPSTAFRKLPVNTMIYLRYTLPENQPAVDLGEDWNPSVLFSDDDKPIRMFLGDKEAHESKNKRLKVCEFKLTTTVQILDLSKLDAQRDAPILAAFGAKDGLITASQAALDALSSYGLVGFQGMLPMQTKAQVFFLQEVRDTLQLIDENKKSGKKQVLLTDMFANMSIGRKKTNTVASEHKAAPKSPFSL
jgi:hypothetical protein